MTEQARFPSPFEVDGAPRSRGLATPLSLLLPLQRGEEGVRGEQVLVLRRNAQSRADLSLRHDHDRELVGGSQPVHDAGLGDSSCARDRPAARERLPLSEPQHDHRREDREGARRLLHQARRLLLRQLGQAVRAVDQEGRGLHPASEGHPDQGPSRGGGRGLRHAGAWPHERLRPPDVVQPPDREHARDGLLPLRDAESRVRRVPDVPRILPESVPGNPRPDRLQDGGWDRHPLLPARRRDSQSREAGDRPRSRRRDQEGRTSRPRRSARSRTHRTEDHG